MNRFFVSGLIVCAILATTVCGQNNGDTQSMTSKGLKDAYAGKFLIGTAGDIPRGYSEDELANIRPTTTSSPRKTP